MMSCGSARTEFGVPCFWDAALGAGLPFREVGSGQVKVTSGCGRAAEMWRNNVDFIPNVGMWDDVCMSPSLRRCKLNGLRRIPMLPTRGPWKVLT